jgi:hypothetical protein
MIRPEIPGTITAALLVATVHAASPPAPAEPEKPWAFYASAYGYFVPGDENYVQPSLIADRGRLHLEARYQYEDMDTGSIWIGYNFSGGDKLAWWVAPMIGGVFGDTDGIAPGYTGSLSWRSFDFSSEGEYVVQADSTENYFYNWSELTFAPVDRFRFGLLTQRTRAYETDRDLERGLLVGFSWSTAELSGYVLNPDDDEPTVIVAAGVSF